MNSREKIEKILQDLKIKAPTFANEIDVLYQRISDIQRGKTKTISGDLAIAINLKFPQYSVGWLVSKCKEIRLRIDDLDYFFDANDIVSYEMLDKKRVKVDLFDKSNLIIPTSIEVFSERIGLEYAFLNKENQRKNEEKLLDETKPMIIDNEEDYKKLKDAGVKLLPEADFNFAAGDVEIFSNPEFIKRYWYLPDCKDCDGVAQISGTSMMPTYPPGCWVALKKIGLDKDTPYTISFGYVFGIVVYDPSTDNYHGHIKILRKYKDEELAKRKWIARSINESEFDDFDILIENVKGLWIVKQHIVSDIEL